MRTPSTAWRVIPASVTGGGHANRGLGCQDAHCVAWLDDGSAIVVVCDGAGSASHAAQGSRLAATTATAFLRRRLDVEIPSDADGWRDLLTECLLHARSALTGAAVSHIPSDCCLDACDFATTMLVAVATPTWIASCQVGDGAIVVRDKAGTLSVLTRPGDSEYLNDTTFLTSPDFIQRAHLYAVDATEATGFAVLSDGLQLLALTCADNSAFAPFFEPMFSFAASADAAPADLEAFLGSPEVRARTDDDVTLVLAVRTSD